MATSLIPVGFDFTDPDLYATRLPLEEFAELRQTAPVWWNSQRRNLAGFGDEGYWVVTRLEDVKEVSRDSELYSSREKTAIIRFDEHETPFSLGTGPNCSPCAPSNPTLPETSAPPAETLPSVTVRG